MQNKIIHQIWMQGWDNLPDKFLSNVQSVIDNNPGYTFMRWDDKSIREALKNGCNGGKNEYLDKYNSFTLLHQRVDFGRYFVLFKYGGVSVDIDVMAHKGFDTLPELATKDFIVSQNSAKTFVNNATILVSQGNPLMKELLDSIKTDCSPYKNDMECIWNTTGPKMFNKFVKDHPNEITVLDPVYFEKCSGYDKYCNVDPNISILDHQHEASWVNPTVKNLLYSFHFCKRNWLFLLIILILIILLIRALR